MTETVAEINAEIANLTTRRADAVTEFESLVDHPELDPQTFARAIASFDRRIEQRQRDIDDLTRKIDDLRRKTDLAPIRASLRESWDLMPITSLRQVMAAIGIVTVGADCSVSMEWAWGKTGDDA